MPDTTAKAQLLSPDQLTRNFNGHFNFTSTAELQPLEGVLGQSRAVQALHFGVSMQRPGYNVFIMGEPGTGRFSYAKRYLTEQAKKRATPSDWLYVNHFHDVREPHAIELPAGEGSRFCADIDTLLGNLLATFPAVFETPAWQQKKSAIDRGFNRRYERALDVVEKLALEKNIALYRDSMNIAFTPMHDGKTLDEAEFDQRPESEREQFHADISELEEQLNKELSSLPQWKRESSNELRELNEETIAAALKPLLAPLMDKYAEHSSVVEYLEAMQMNLLKTVVEQLVDADH